MGAEPGVLRRPEELDAGWMSAVLGTGPIGALHVTPIGTGQMSESRRVHIDYAGPADGAPTSVVLKTASADETSRATGVGLGAYEREVRFYRELAPRIGGPLARCHLAEIDDEGWFTLVLEDIAPAEQGDQIGGCGVEEARLAVRELARLHAPVFADPQLGATPWLNQGNVLSQALLGQLLPAFLERYGDRVESEHRELCERVVASLDGWYADRRPPLGLVHGDYRLDNMLFGTGQADRAFVVVDWQTVGWGPVMTDVAYFIGGALAPERRREHERALVREYHEQLLGHGVTGFGWETCWEEYRRQVFLGILMVIAPAMIVQRTERGDEMFLTSLARYAQQALELESLDLLPRPGTGRPSALRPDAVEEGRHAPGPERLWNESWYFDVLSADGSFGLYTRLGLYPNMGLSWLTALACGPGRPTVAVIDFAAPLPAGGELSLRREGLRAAHECEAPLERFRVRLDAAGEAHDDAAALLRGERGEPLQLGFDLTWETDGEPYAYRVTTRYEIPCRVRGTVTLGEETIAVSGIGQRDHSWGTRDWWSAEWVWSAGGLEDGTRLHGVEFRIPGSPPIGVGYVQPAEGGIEELDAVGASEEVAADGLIRAAEIRFGELAVDVRPLAFGPLRLEASDGRVSEFPRAMCAIRARDGRSGLAWVEWNRNASLIGPAERG
jgi:thiamine kinase-like enzyme